MKNKILITLLFASIFADGIFAQINFLPTGRTVIPSSRGYTNAGRINQTVKFLADQLSQNKDFANMSDSRIAITSFVNIENLRETSKIGNLISEHLIHDMQIRGYKVIDYKTMPDIEIGEKGDYAFSRVVENLRQDVSLSFILAGTYTYYADGVSLNARMIDALTSVVVSTAQAFIPTEDLRHITDSMLPMNNSGSRGGGAGGEMTGSLGINGMIVPGTEGTRIKLKKATW